MSTPVVTVEWPGSLEALDRLHAHLEQMWATHTGVAVLDRMALAISVAEIVANAVEHGEAGSIWFGVEVTAAHITVAVEDDGSSPPRRIRSHLITEDPMAESGRGMAMARHLTTLSHTREDDRNRWIIVRDRTPDAS